MFEIKPAGSDCWFSTGALLRPLLCLVLISGCADTVDIDARDRVNFSNLELAVPLKDDGSMQLRLRGSAADGEFSQTLDDDERIGIDNEEIRGSARIDGELDLRYYSLAFGWNHALGSSGAFRAHYHGGFAYTDFDLTLESADQRIRESDGNGGLYLQYALDYAPTESLTLGFSWAVGLGEDISNTSEIDLKAQYAPWEQFYLAGGYRWFEYEVEEVLFESTVQIDFEGPYLGLGFRF